MDQNKRIIYLDYIRVLAIFLVIGMHSPIPVENANGMVYAFITVLCTPCNALFFMVSGALILPMKEDSWMPFLKHRLAKVVIPMLFWSAVTLIIQYWDGTKTATDIISDFGLLLFYPHANPNYWFIYVLLGLYLLTPILSPWIKKSNQSEIRYYLCLWVLALVTMLLSYANVKMPKIENAPLYYFGGWVGYFVLGYYLRSFNFRINYIICIICIVLPFVIYVWLKYASWDYQKVMGYLSLLTALSATSYFVLLKRISLRCGLIEKMSNLSFGVYLIHILIRDNIVCRIPAIYSHGSLVMVLSIWALTLFLSFSIIYVITKFPYSKYLIGYSSNK